LNQNTRQRLIGTLVLGLLALILLPMIFDGEGSYQPPLQTNIPAEPARPDVTREMPTRPVITADTDAIRIRPQTEPEQEPAQATDEPASASEQTEAGTDNAGLAQADSDSTASDTADAAPQTAEAAPETAQAAAETAQATTGNQQAEEVTSALDYRGLPEAWSVRLASFSSQANASNLLNRLVGDGHRAYTRQIDSSQGTLTAVFVGPLVDRAAAQMLLELLRTEYELNGLVVRYQIEE
tara:strand:- start:3789 stop:4505 length:717 start_codon:yes stop_codon:yes gene_type:complete